MRNNQQDKEISLQSWHLFELKGIGSPKQIVTAAVRYNQGLVFAFGHMAQFNPDSDGSSGINTQLYTFKLANRLAFFIIKLGP